MGSITAQLQADLWGLLEGDSTLSALITGVFDEVPENQAFPYVTLGEVNETPRDTFPKKGRVATPLFTIFSQAKGFKEALTIANQIDVLVNRFPFTYAGYSHVSSMFTSLSATRLPDGLTRKVDIRYNVFAEET